MNLRERFLEVTNFNTSVHPIKWESATGVRCWINGRKRPAQKTLPGDPNKINNGTDGLYNPSLALDQRRRPTQWYRCNGWWA